MCRAGLRFESAAGVWHVLGIAERLCARRRLCDAAGGHDDVEPRRAAGGNGRRRLQHRRERRLCAARRVERQRDGRGRRHSAEQLDGVHCRRQHESGGSRGERNDDLERFRRRGLADRRWRRRGRRFDADGIGGLAERQRADGAGDRQWDCAGGLATCRRCAGRADDHGRRRGFDNDRAGQWAERDHGDAERGQRRKFCGFERRDGRRAGVGDLGRRTCHRSVDRRRRDLVRAGDPSDRHFDLTRARSAGISRARSMSRGARNSESGRRPGPAERRRFWSRFRSIPTRSTSAARARCR